MAITVSGSTLGRFVDARLEGESHVNAEKITPRTLRLLREFCQYQGVLPTLLISGEIIELEHCEIESELGQQKFGPGSKASLPPQSLTERRLVCQRLPYDARVRWAC